MPSLAPLAAAGIPVVSEAEYRAGAPRTDERRALLAGLLADGGWATDGTV